LCNQSVGLIARGIEASGISTVCVSFRKEITRLSRPPRILSVNFSAGKPLGNPGDGNMQRKIIEAGFSLLQNTTTDMTILDLPYKSSKFRFL
jgi:D-proline reductase (dithiol) PrdB